MLAGTGYIHTRPNQSQLVASVERWARIGAGFVPTHHPPFDEVIDREWNQFSTNACTGYSTTRCATVMAAVAGIEVPALSALYTYSLARIKSAGEEALAVDKGARVYDVAWAFNHWGPASELYFPSYTIADRNELLRRVHSRPGHLAEMSAKANRARLGLKLTRIVDDAKNLPLRIAHSLHSNQYCLVALPVENWSSTLDVLPGQQMDKLRGWHFVGLSDWRIVAGELQCHIVNSWGRSRRQWASQALLQQASAVYYCERVER